jgi:hypothetical protein
LFIAAIGMRKIQEKKMFVHLDFLTGDKYDLQDTKTNLSLKKVSLILFDGDHLYTKYVMPYSPKK